MRSIHFFVRQLDPDGQLIKTMSFAIVDLWVLSVLSLWRPAVLITEITLTSTIERAGLRQAEVLIESSPSFTRLFVSSRVLLGSTATPSDVGAGKESGRGACPVSHMTMGFEGIPDE
jgi:hypothetical protein